MAKAILLVRVSTLSQTYEQQTKDLIEFAVKDGYAEKDLIVIEAKESARKLKEEERLGLNLMKEYIANDPSIICVYCREINRIGRRYDVLTSMKSFFVNNKIQLVTTENNRRLLDNNNELSLEGSIMFEVACSVAVNEMRDKELRFSQGKRKAVEEGKAVTGKVLFGYRIDEKTKRIEIDDADYGNTASVIEYIFDAYTTTSMSTKAIYLELSRQGKFSSFSRDDIGANQIRRIIMNRAYSGGTNNNGVKNSKKVYDYHYKAIVSKQTQDKAIEKCENAKKQPKYSHKHVYYAKSIIKCVCGHTMIGDSYRNAYKCPYCSKHIGLNAVDTVAWKSAIVLKTEAEWQDKTATKAKYETDIASNIKKIEYLEKKLVELDEIDAKNIMRCSRMQNQIMADKLLEKLFSDTENERKSVNQEILRLKEATRQMEQYLKNSTVNISQSATGAIASIEDDNMRRDIILEVISQIKLEQQDALHIKISIVPNLAIARDYPFYYVYDQSKRPYIRLLRYAFGKFDRDITSLIIERFHTPLSKGIRLAKEEKQRRIGEKVSIADIVEKYGYSYTTVYGFVRHGVLKGEMINRKVYIALEDAEAFFSKRNKGK